MRRWTTASALLGILATPTNALPALSAISPDQLAPSAQTTLVTSASGVDVLSATYVLTTIPVYSSVTTITTVLTADEDGQPTDIVVGSGGVAWVPVATAPGGPKLPAPTDFGGATPTDGASAMTGGETGGETGGTIAGTVVATEQSSDTDAFAATAAAVTTISADGATQIWNKAGFSDLATITAPTTVTTNIAVTQTDGSQTATPVAIIVGAGGTYWQPSGGLGGGDETGGSSGLCIWPFCHTDESGGGGGGICIWPFCSSSSSSGGGGGGGGGEDDEGDNGGEDDEGGDDEGGNGESDGEDENDGDNDDEDDNDEEESSSCTSSATALRVTSQCVVSTITSAGSTTPTTTCTSSTAVETTGCSVTDTTTSVFTTTSVGMGSMCARGKCGNACPQPGPLTISQNPGSAPTACTFASTVTTGDLPTAASGLWGSATIDTSVPSGVPGDVVSKRAHPGVLEERTEISSSANISIRMPTLQDPDEYVSDLSMDTVWIDIQAALVTGVWEPFATDNVVPVGVKGLWGCTAAIVISDDGVFVSHLFEYPIFGIDWVDTSDDFFNQNGIRALLDGGTASAGIIGLKGTDAAPGPLHKSKSPTVIVVTPFTDKRARDTLGITTLFHYEDRANRIAREVATELTGTTEGNNVVVGYKRTGPGRSEAEDGYVGRAIVEFDPHHEWHPKDETDPESDGFQIGMFRLWVENRAAYQQMVIMNPPGSPGPVKRDVGYPNPCAGDDAGDSDAEDDTPSTTTGGPGSSFTTITTIDPDNPLGLPTLTATKCATSSCVNGQWIYSDLPTNSPCPTETITTGCMTTAAVPTSSSGPSPPPSSPAFQCGNLSPNNEVEPLTPGVGVPVCFAADMVHNFCSSGLVGRPSLIGGHVQPQTIIFPFKYESQEPHAATDGLYVSLQNVKDGDCTPPVLEGDKDDNGTDEQCVGVFMNIINSCDTNSGSEKKGGTHNIDCQVWSIFPVNMQSGFDHDPNVWSGDPDYVNESWDYCNDPEHYLDIGDYGD